MMHHLRPLVVAWKTAAVASRFLGHMGTRRLIAAYGDEIPDIPSIFWMSGQRAARLTRASLAPDLIAPGPRWIETLDTQLTGRKIHIGTRAHLPKDTMVFAKPAELKVADLPAGLYLSDHFSAEAEALGVHKDSLVQWTTDILDLNHEHRFYICEGQALTCSPYLVDGDVYAPGMTSPKTSSANAFVDEVLQHLITENICPPAFVMDVAYDIISRSWIVLESNPAWSSGPYGCRPGDIVTTIDRAHQYDDHWSWKPDVDLLARANDLPTITTHDIATSTTLFEPGH